MAVTGICRIAVTIQEETWEEDAMEVLRVIRSSWVEQRENDKIKSKIFTDGITNKLVGFYLESTSEDVVMIKVYGANTDLMIDRQAEIDTMTKLHLAHCGPQLYAVFENGIAYEYIPGTTLTMESCRSPSVYPRVAAEMARFHQAIPLLPPEGEGDNPPRSQMWQKMREFHKLNVSILRGNPDLAQRLVDDCGYTHQQAKQDIDDLEAILEKESIPLAFCHNDLHLANVLHNEETARVAFIDFEYAMPNYVTFDMANHFLEFAGMDNPDFAMCPDKSFRRKWIAVYLQHFGKGKGDLTLEQVGKWVELCIPACHLLWTLWCVVQAEYSTIDFDYAGYVSIRYVEFKKHMRELSGDLEHLRK